MHHMISIFPRAMAVLLAASACMTASAGFIALGDLAKPGGAAQAMTGKQLAAREAAVSSVAPGQSVDPSFMSKWFPGAAAAGSSPLMSEVINGERHDVAFVKGADGAWVKVSKKIVDGEPSGEFASMVNGVAKGRIDPREVVHGEVISVAPRGRPGEGAAPKAPASKPLATKIEPAR